MFKMTDILKSISPSIEDFVDVTFFTKFYSQLRRVSLYDHFLVVFICSFYIRRSFLCFPSRITILFLMALKADGFCC